MTKEQLEKHKADLLAAIEAIKREHAELVGALKFCDMLMEEFEDETKEAEDTE